MTISVLSAGLIGTCLALPTLALTTPRRWWQRPTLFACAILGLLSFVFAQALLFAFAKPTTQPELLPLADATPAITPAPAPAAKVKQGQLFRAKYRLNLRAFASTSAPYLASIEAMQLVQVQGPQVGDWWFVQVPNNDASCAPPRQGWVNSLWLRKPDELPSSDGKLSISQGKEKVGCATRTPSPKFAENAVQ